MHPVLRAAEKLLGYALEAEGDESILDQPRRAILISRAKRKPAPGDPDVSAVIQAVDQAAARGEAIVVGANRAIWDVAVLRAKTLGVPVILVNDGMHSESLLPGRRLVVTYTDPSNLNPQRLNIRGWPIFWGTDREFTKKYHALVAELADRATVIRMNAQGHMALIFERLHDRGCPIEPLADSESIPHVRRKRVEVIVQDATGWVLPPEHEWLTHFTRKPDTEWPGEEYLDYIAWLSSGPNAPPRDDFAALCRILEQRRVVACSDLIPGCEPMVCFTALPPRTALTLRRWRKGLRRWNFTPYALSLSRERLQALGARPVQYLSEIELCKMGDDRQFQQPASCEIADWREEQEWRIHGDLALDRVANEHLIALVPTRAEAEHIEQRFGIRALAAIR